MTLKKNQTVLQQQKKSFQPNSSDHQLSGSLDGRNIFPSGAPTGTLSCERPFFTSNPIKSCIVFISENLLF